IRPPPRSTLFPTRRSSDLLQIHAADERLAHRIGGLKQDFAVALRFDEIPDDEPLLQGQRFKHVRDVGRMHGVELRAKLGDVLPRSEEHTSELQSLAYLVCR